MCCCQSLQGSACFFSLSHALPAVQGLSHGQLDALNSGPAQSPQTLPCADDRVHHLYTAMHISIGESTLLQIPLETAGPAHAYMQFTCAQHQAKILYCETCLRGCSESRQQFLGPCAVLWSRPTRISITSGCWRPARPFPGAGNGARPPGRHAVLCQTGQQYSLCYSQLVSMTMIWMSSASRLLVSAIFGICSMQNK